MEPECKTVICIEFIYAEECPYCPTVKQMLLDLLESEAVNDFIIIEEIDINSAIGKERAFKYKLKGVPAIALNGKLKFQGVPHPTLLLGEVKRLIRESQNPKPLKPQKSQPIIPPDVSDKSDNDMFFYT
jgi:thioredoxin 1